ncbi:MAG: DUF3108 domain-containing protein [Proteobacteria bacterium]|nr:DUF3108 domain-containing protein [Pseudomonadota bacterium]
MPQAGAGGSAAEFAVSIRGFRVASLTLAGARDGAAYDVAGTLASAGLLGWVRHIRYDASVTGRFLGPRPVPSRYVENADTGKRQSQAVMAYRDGVPQVKSYSPPRPPTVQEIAPSSQGGTVDPLTALYMVLRDVPKDQACDLRLTLFDGRRRSQVVLGPAETEGGRIACAGEYRRLQGFTDADMAEKSRFPFRLTYDDAGGGLVHVTEISMDTLYGKGWMIRR